MFHHYLDVLHNLISIHSSHLYSNLPTIHIVLLIINFMSFVIKLQKLMCCISPSSLVCVQGNCVYLYRSSCVVSLPQPCVCTRELCVFAFQTLGVMADAAEAIATDGDVSELEHYNQGRIKEERACYQYT